MTSTSSLRFAGVAAVVATLATVLVARAPIQFALASVFLFAGPHNLMEFRYALARLPSRLGPLRRFFVVGIGGALLLTVWAIAIPGATRFGGSAATLAWWATAWNLALVGWIATLTLLRSREKPVRDWRWTAPLALALAALVCWRPTVWSLALVYLHPLVSFVVLDREMRRHHRHWRATYHALLSMLPLLLALVWWSLRDAPPLQGAGSDALTMRLTAQAGGDTLAMLPTRALVATLALLELLHYTVWIVAIPIVTGQGAPWQGARVPFVRGSVTGQRVLRLALGALAVAVVALWIAFTADYSRARDLYFTLAIAHVLAEVPLVLRLA